MVLATGSVPGITGSVPGPPEGSGGPPGGATSPGGLHGPIVGRDQPLGGLGRLPPRPKVSSRGEGANPRRRWALRPTLGAPPLSPPWPPPRWDLGAATTPREGTLGGGAAPPLPLYILEVWAAHTHEFLSFLAQPYPSSSSSLVVLGEALLESRAPPPPPRRRAAAGWSLPQPLLLPLLDKGIGDVTGLYVC